MADILEVDARRDDFYARRRARRLLLAWRWALALVTMLGASPVKTMRDEIFCRILRDLAASTPSCGAR